MTNKIKVLIIEDESNIRRLLISGLPHETFEFFQSGTADIGLKMVRETSPDLIILDLGLPDMEGSDFIRNLRSWSNTPVLVLTARGDEQSKVEILDLGANDYVTKPFGLLELHSRIKAILRVNNPFSFGPKIFKVKSISINFDSREVFKEGELIHLTPKEFELLAMLAREAGKVLTHKQLLESIWGPTYARQNHYLRIFMKNLRHKLEESPSQPQVLLTESGIGYRLKSDEDAMTQGLYKKSL